MSRKDSFEFGSSKNKAPKENPKREKSEGKKLFGDGGSFGGGSSFGKSSSFGGSSSFGKEKKEKPKKEKKENPLFSKINEGKSTFGTGSEKKPIFGGFKSEKAESFGSEKEKKSLFGKQKDSSFGSGEKKEKKKLKWWQLLLIVVSVIIIVVGIVAAVLIGKISGMIPGGIGGVGDIDDTPIIGGAITSVGSFLPNNSQDYVLCEYTEYFSGQTVFSLQNSSDIRYGYQGYWVFISASGTPNYTYSGLYTGNYTPEEIKEQMLAVMSNAAGYTPEIIARCDVHVYEPVSFTRVAISSVALDSDGNVTIKYSAGAVDGEMSEEYELIGTYTKTDNDFAFSYSNIPEDANLLRVAETLLGSAKYDYYAQYGQWMNKLTFGDYELYLTEDDSADDDTTDDDVVNDGTTDDDVVNDDTTDDDVVNDDTTDDDVVNDDTTDDDVVNDDNVNDDSLDDDTVNDDSSNDDSSDNTL